MLRSLLCLLCMVITIANAESNNQSAPNRDTKRRYLSCNWKCTIQTSNRADGLCDDINRMWNSLSETEREKVALCVHPPYVFIDRVRRRLHREIGVGSQNVFDARGPNIGNTGTVDPTMLRSLGCDSVLLGHSDRRNNLGETDRLIRDKVRKCLSAGLRVTLTVGELPRQRRWGLALPTLRKQLLQAAKGIRPDEWDRIVVAYEPVWAVGEGATPCSSREAQRIAAYLRGLIARHVRADAAAACTLTYTGSVNEANAAEYASLNDVEGFVVGRAGLDMTKLRSIIRTLANSQYD